MTYLLIQMGVYLVVAACLGMLLGFSVQGMRMRKREDYWSSRFAELKREKDFSLVEKSFQRMNPLTSESYDVKIDKVTGPSREQCERLNDLGISNVSDLLSLVKEPTQIVELAEKIEVDEIEITRWARRADIMRIPGMEGDNSKLLEESGVCSADQLAGENPQRLASVLKMVVEKEGVSAKVPDADSVATWVEKAHDLKKIANS